LDVLEAQFFSEMLIANRYFHGAVNVWWYTSQLNFLRIIFTRSTREQGSASRKSAS
jgi:hypothetical protein